MVLRFSADYGSGMDNKIRENLRSKLLAQNNNSSSRRIGRQTKAATPILTTDNVPS